MHGFFSKKMCLFVKEKRELGHVEHRQDDLGRWMAMMERDLAVVYSTPGGGELVVTSVAENPMRGNSWADEKPVGEVLNYLRPATEADIVKAYPFMAKSLSGNDLAGTIGADLLRKLVERAASSGQGFTEEKTQAPGDKKP